MSDELVFGKYEILRRLAIGGMGEIFLARQRDFVDRLVILKTLHSDLAEDETAISEFLDEARVAATFSHPNIIQIFEVGRWNGIYLIAMEYIKGDNLFVLVSTTSKRKQHVPVPVTARIMHDAALGLDYAHHAVSLEGVPLGVVHRDVSPQNLMVTSEGVTKVVDFGIASAANRESRTRTGVIKGKLRYMAPEQILGTELDARTDQFALGVVFWELLTARRLFRKGESELETYRSVLNDPIPAPSTLVKGLSPEIDAIVLRMTNRDKDARYPRCLDVAHALEAYLKTTSSGLQTSNVAAFVNETLGEKIAERSRELSSVEQNFLISLAPSSAAQPTRTDRRSAESGVSAPPAATRTSTAPASTTFPVPARTAARPFGELSGNSNQATSTRGSSRTPLRAAPQRSNWGRAGIFILAAGGLVALGMVAVDLLNPPAQETAASSSPPSPSPRPTEPAPAPPAVPAAKILLRTTPENAEVLLDGESVGQTPLTVDESKMRLNRPTRLELRLAGYASVRMDDQILEPGRQRELFVTLVRETEPAPRSSVSNTRTRRPVPERKPAASSGSGFLTLETTPWSLVHLGGTALGSTPLFRVELPAGVHELRLAAEGKAPAVTRKVTIEAGRVNKLHLRL